jgi:hypothetical protein
MTPTLCALALVACLRTFVDERVFAQAAVPNVASAPYPAVATDAEPLMLIGWDEQVQQTAAPPSATNGPWTTDPGVSPTPYVAQGMPVEGTWIAPSAPPGTYYDPGMPGQTTWTEGVMAQPFTEPSQGWFWQVLPDGLIYHSYWAGVHEPRLGIVAMSEQGTQSFWDGTLGGRVGLLRYGDAASIFPQGWQMDVEAAAIIRMTLDEIRDFEFADYRVGIPITYGIDNWQFKFAGYHLSSHLGDEFAIANPGSLDDRINYVRDALVFGASVYPVPIMRLYAEAAYAFNVDGGAKPWEFQFGTELSQPGPTGPRGTPYFAVNGHLREEHDFGGDISTNAGWLWRGQSGQTVRAGVHYFNGKSSQYQIFDEHEQQIGFGLWYDF